MLNVERVRDRENVLAVAIDASASMAYGEADRSRLQEVAAALQKGTLAKLEDTFEVRLFGFAQTTTPLDTLDAMPAPGPQTRIGDSLIQVLQSAGSIPLAGVVLFSDGAENGGSLSEERLTEIASYGVPIHTVGVGPEQVAGDLELERLDVPASAPVGSTVNAQVGIRHTGAGATRLRVYDRETLVAARDIQLPRETTSTSLTIDLPAGEPGTHELRFALDPLEGERNTINNSRTRVVDVPATRRSILYVEGEPRWEYKFLRRAAERDRALRVASVVRTTPNKYYRQGVDSGRGARRRISGQRARAVRLRRRRDRQLRGRQPAARAASIAERVRRPARRLGADARAVVTALQPAVGRTRRSRRRCRRNSPGGRSWVSCSGRCTRSRLSTACSRRSCASIPTRSATQIVGRACRCWPTTSLSAGSSPARSCCMEATAERTRAPLLLWQHYGRGATFVLATASTLRWQMQLPPEDESHEVFWRQLLHAISASAPPRASIEPERLAYDDERNVRLVAELRNERFEPINDASVELRIAPQAEPAFTQPMQPSGQGDGRYVAGIDAATAGLYRIEMTARAGGREVGNAITHVLRNDGVAEHFGTYQHRAALERLAAMTGGRYWPLDELDGLAAAIPYSKAGVVERQTLDLWNLPIVFLVLLALKLGEWLLRLRWGRL